MKRFLKDFRRYGNYMVYAAKAELKRELGSSRIGWVWWIIEPAAFMLIYMFVYSVAFRKTTEYPVAFIFIGISLWRFFNGSVQSSVQLIKKNRTVISKVYLPKFSLVIITVLKSGVKLLFSFPVVAGLLVFYQIAPTPHLLRLVPVFIMLGLLTFGLGLLVMHIGVYFEDLGNFLRPVLQLLFYASGVFYPLDGAWDGVTAERMLWLNPIALALNEARKALLYKEAANWMGIGFWTVFGVLLSANCLLMIYRSEKEYIKLV